ncbi:hypothetical protein [Streptomyces dysideae]|uniref:Uncharacterized protein n=1 Tax=Streptomyces dysideae TaxID=909626 RepID=A0A101V2S5_9ACTN|nr:hypothetical protein [Streptomyces dysideae]KUO21474.1 hypothetical protein AQJ91_09065 [Streptomyces dysideae]
MTQTAEQRLAVAERQLSELRIEVAKLNVLVGVLMYRDAPEEADTEAVARAVNVVKEARPARLSSREDHLLRRPRAKSRPRLRLVDDVGSVDGQDLEEGLRRVRAGRGDGR